MLSALLAVGLGTVLTLGGLSKLRNRAQFAAALEEYRPRVPSLQGLALAWAAVEMIAGLWALGSPSYRLVPISVALSVATGSVLKRVWQGQEHGCGCHAGGGAIGPKLLAKNSVVITALVAVQTLQTPTAGPAISIGCAVAVAAGFLAVGSASSSPRHASQVARATP